jgi:hypothetical protein
VRRRPLEAASPIRACSVHVVSMPDSTQPATGSPIQTRSGDDVIKC